MPDTQPMRHRRHRYGTIAAAAVTDRAALVSSARDHRTPCRAFKFPTIVQCRGQLSAATRSFFFTATIRTGRVVFGDQMTVYLLSFTRRAGARLPRPVSLHHRSLVSLFRSKNTNILYDTERRIFDRLRLHCRDVFRLWKITLLSDINTMLSPSKTHSAPTVFGASTRELKKMNCFFLLFIYFC